jgi:DNA repair exonuclease SbcCD ATPase subunit
MSEPNSNATPFDSQSRDEVTESCMEASQNPDTTGSSAKKMNWQKVAHKLREYNRKLLKQVFKLEQDIAEIDNRFKKHLEKSQSSDLLAAQQAEEIKGYQEEICLLTQELDNSQQKVRTKETKIQNLEQKLELSQQQVAQLERECTFLQENYNQKTYELITQEKETEELQSRLSRQQQYVLQYKADLDRYINQVAIPETTKEAISANSIPKNNIPKNNNKPIQPWSTTISEPRISLPQTHSKPLSVSHIAHQPAETIKATTEIAQWSLPAIAKSNQGKKPQSLAAVNLPQFPRPK